MSDSDCWEICIAKGDCFSYHKENHWDSDDCILYTVGYKSDTKKIP